MKSKEGEGTILLVEDEEMLGELYTRTFERAPYRFVWVKCTDDARAFLEKEKPDILFLDLIVPEKLHGILDYGKRQGFEFLKKYRKQLPKNVIVFTNLDDNEDRQTAQKMGVSDYMVKANLLPKEIIQIADKYIGSYAKKGRKITARS